jgi:hypothetical protein
MCWMDSLSLCCVNLGSLLPFSGLLKGTGKISAETGFSSPSTVKGIWEKQQERR